MTFAFTLAEVLITLTIIGVIAALTIPNLMQKWQDNADVAKVKEGYSILNNAMKMAVIENGLYNDWPNTKNANSIAAKVILANTLSKYLKVSRFCEKRFSCLGYSSANGGFKELSGKNTAELSANVQAYDQPVFLLNNGMAIIVMNADFNRDYSTIYVDINGPKGPNRIGYDAFEFRFYNTTTNIIRPNSYVGSCNINNSDKDSGRTCSAWILKKGSMDYKYRDISAEW